MTTRMRRQRWRRTFLACLLAHAASASEPAWVDARVTTTMQLFQQALVPGLPGAVTRVEPAFPLTLSSFVRFGGVLLPRGDGVVSGELSAWGRLGSLDGTLGDGDVSLAFAQYANKTFRVRLGRQVVLPGSARYVRFDGASAGVSYQLLDVDVYGGWVALPRWSLPRGAVLAGFATDALLVPALVEAQNRTGQFTWGARVAARFAVGHAALAVHEQRDLTGVAYRVVSADAQVQAGSAVSLGGRLTFDTTALAVSEARLFVDLATPVVPLSVDYSYQSPALLLPRTSILAAFGGASWHELGAEATLVAMQSLKLSARAAGQLFEQDRLGGRASLKATWVPDIDRRGLVLAEAGRVYAPPSGFTFARVGARWRATPVVWLSGDGSVYRYDQPIRGVSSSVTGVGSVEWAPLARMRVVLSGTVMTTPYSTFEAQGLAKLVIELGTNTEGSTP